MACELREVYNKRGTFFVGALMQYPGTIGRIVAFAAVCLLMCLVTPVFASPVPGDANLDGRVDDMDVSSLAGHWQQKDRCWGEGDFSGDGWVNDLDVALLASKWQYGVNGEDPPTAPEPSSIVIWGLLGFSCVVATRRRPHGRFNVAGSSFRENGK